MTSKTSPELKTSNNNKKMLASLQTLECNQSCKKNTTKQKGRENTSDEVMQSGFVVISHHYKYRSVLEASQESWKGITFPTVSLSWVLIFPFFVQIGKSSCPFLSESQGKICPPKCTFPSVPQGTWEKVGFSICWQHFVSGFSLHTSCHRVWEWDYPTHGVTNLNTKHKQKNTVKMDDRVGVSAMVWSLNCRLEA